MKIAFREAGGAYDVSILFATFHNTNLVFRIGWRYNDQRQHWVNIQQPAIMYGKYIALFNFEDEE